MKKEQDRNLSIYRYFEKLQREYVVAELRHKIYPKIKDKKYWGKVMEGKKKTIQDIALKNSLESIFSSKEKELKLRFEIYKDGGLPNFIYRDNNQKEQLHYFDKINYFAKNSEVRIKRKNAKDLIGSILFYNFEEDIVTVEVLGENERLTICSENIVRIL